MDVLINEAERTYFNMTAGEGYDLQGIWVSISLKKWITYLENRTFEDFSSITDDCLQEEFLNFIIQNINASSFGSGCDYELYEERKQTEISEFLFRLPLTPEEFCYFKQKTEYVDDFSTYSMICSNCGKEDTAFSSAKSLQMEGVELCTHCLNSAYM